MKIKHKQIYFPVWKGNIRKKINSSNRIIFAKMQIFSKANSKEDHFTTLAPCIGILFYNLKNKESYIMHEPYTTKSNLVSKIIQIKKDWKIPLKKITVNCYGGSETNYVPPNRGNNQLISKEKQYAEKILKKIFPEKNLSFDWAKNDTITSFYLDKQKETQHIFSQHF